MGAPHRNTLGHKDKKSMNGSSLDFRGTSCANLASPLIHKLNDNVLIILPAGILSLPHFVATLKKAGPMHTGLGVCILILSSIRMMLSHLLK